MTNKNTVFQEKDNRIETEEQDEVYEIKFKGHLSDRWASRFAEFELIREKDGTTLIVGPVTDQSALHSLINTVRDLGLKLISVNRIKSRPNGPNEISCTTDI